jgi:DNA replication and repair protein RecF
MGVVSALKLRHFRCFEAHEVQFEPGVNFIVGPNAQGKTSLLEGVCILLRLQSPRVSRLPYVVQHGRRGFAVDGYAGDRHLQFYFSRERKKLLLDGVEQRDASDYLAVGRVVYFSNADMDLVRGGADGRRRFLDFLASQRDGTYRTALRSYERALRSRNLLLKSPAPRWREIAAFDEPLVASGERLRAARERLVDELQPAAAAAHQTISGGREVLGIRYRPGCGADFGGELKAARSEDARLRQSTRGPHRDDLELDLDGRGAEFGSEGQQRTLALALRLGAANLLAAHFEEPPVLLLDDVFGELDPGRRNALLAALPEGSQKLITTTHLGWLAEGSVGRTVRMG